MRGTVHLSRIVFCTILGALLGMTLFVVARWVWAEGIFVRWHKLASPPAELVELVAAVHEIVYAKTSTGVVYHCYSWNDVCWIQDEIPQDLYQEPLKDVEITKPCNYSARMFSWLSNSPNDITDCIQGKEIRIDCVGKFAYILDEDGNVWEWTHYGCLDGAWIVGALCISTFGAVIGAIIGLTGGASSPERRSANDIESN